MNKRTKIMIGVLAAVAVGAVAFFFLGGGEEEPELSSTGGESATTVVEVEILALLNTLRGIEFNETLLMQEEFLSLVDFSVELRPQPIGRPNPFAPIGVDAQPLVQGNSSEEDTSPESVPLEESEDFAEEELDSFEEDFDLGEFEDF